MDLLTSLTGISELPESLTQAVTGAAAFIPEELSKTIRHAASYVPAQVDLVTAAQFMLYFTAASLILGVLSRVVLGKRSSLNHSLSSAVGILFVYVFTVVIYTFNPWNLDALLSPLPFVTFSGDYLIVFPISDGRITALCSQALALVILSFLVNLIDTILPKGNTAPGWYCLRIISVILSMLLHLAVRWALRTYLPDALVTYAPIALLVILAFMLLSGVLNLVFGVVLTMSNPFLGAMYTFFFSNIIGKQLSKAVFSSAIICVILLLLEQFGYTVITISAAALLTYIPIVIILLILWYLIGFVL